MRVTDIQINIKPSPAYGLHKEEKNKTSITSADDDGNGCDRVWISFKQAGGRQPEQEQERNMPINGISASEYYANQVGRKHGRHGGGKADAASFDECCKAASVEPGGEQQAAEQAPTQGPREVSFSDPWPPGHPFRKECDEFLELFQQTLKEVLEEKGLSPKEGDPVILSESEMEDVRREVGNKLSKNHHAVQLMTLLQVDLPSDWGETDSKKAWDRGLVFEDPKIGQQRMYEALGPEGYKEYMEMSNRMSRDIEMGGNGNIMIPGMSGYSMRLAKLEADPVAGTQYKLLMLRIQDKVVSDLGLDLSTLKAGSPEALQAIRMIGERIMADPEGKQLMATLGLTAVNDQGMPTAPGIWVDGHEPTPNPMFDADGNLLEAEADSAETGEGTAETADAKPNAIHWRDLMASALAEQLATSLRPAETAGMKSNAIHGRGSMASVADEQLAMSLRLMGLTPLDMLNSGHSALGGQAV
jgi:hypothetical protein